MDEKKAPLTRKECVAAAKRIVVKLGTSTVLGGEGGERAFLAGLASQVKILRDKGLDVVLVSSGAIGLGLKATGKTRKPTAVPAQQALAAIGQRILMDRFAEAFEARGILVGQVLLTYGDIEDRKRHTHVYHALEALLRTEKAVPVINENDTVAVDEIRVGDNDALAAMVTNLCGADLLVLLSDVPGFYRTGKAEDGILDEVAEITDELKAAAGGAGTEGSTGGMASKLRAAEIVTAAGEGVVIAAGGNPTVLTDLMEGKPVGTFFRPRADAMTSRKRWIAFALRVQGSLIVDEGGREAIVENGKSLLASGIREVEGEFLMGAGVALRLEGGGEFARGRVNFSAAEIRRIQGRHSKEIEGILGTKTPAEVVHRDDMVIL